MNNGLAQGAGISFDDNARTGGFHRSDGECHARVPVRIGHNLGLLKFGLRRQGAAGGWEAILGIKFAAEVAIDAEINQLTGDGLARRISQADLDRESSGIVARHRL